MTTTAWLQLVPVDAVATQARAAGLAWLTAGERERLEAMSAPARRDAFLAGHWQLRQLAAQWLRQDAGSLDVHAHPDGRPALFAEGALLPLHASLSHSDGWLALALADVPVGVDIELPRRTRDWGALAAFAFSPDEVRRLCAQDAAGQAAVFHALWTLKEARGKRGGEGLLPRAARKVTACECGDAHAEAFSWPFRQGALALAGQPGMQLRWQGPGTALAPATAWRYVAAGVFDLD